MRTLLRGCLRVTIHSLCLFATTLLLGQVNPQEEKFVRWVEQNKRERKVLSDRVLEWYAKVKDKKGTIAQKTNLQKSIENHHKISQAEECEKTVTENCKESCRKHHTCHKIRLTKKDFGSDGLKITQPGYYVLAEDVTFKPNQDNIPAITILSDCVVFDFCGHTLKQSEQSFALFDNTTAVIIKSGYSNIKVKNGTITSFSDQGIWAETTQFSPTEHFGIIIDNIKVKECGKSSTSTLARVFESRAGIGIDGTTGVVIKNCQVFTIQADVEVDAISTIFSDNVFIEHCISANSSANDTTGFSAGISVNFFNNALIYKCEGLNVTSWFTNGIFGVLGDNLTIAECIGHNNRGAGFSLGISGADVQNVEVLNCQANENVISNTDQTGLAAGFDFFPGNNLVFMNCTASRNAVEQNAMGPFTLESGAWSFKLDNQSTNVLFENCTAMQSNVNSQAALVRSLGGFLFRRFCSNIIAKNCTVSGMVSDTASMLAAGFVAGDPHPQFENFVTSNVVIDSCIVEDTHNTQDATNGFGVIFGETVNNSSIVNCIVKANDVGVQLEGADTLSNVIQNNEITASITYGINDITGNSGNAYVSNFSFNPHATNFCPPLSGDANFCGLPSGTPVRTWQIGFPPANANNNGVIGDKLDNLDVTF